MTLQLLSNREQITKESRGRLVLSINSHSISNYQGCTLKYKFSNIEGLETKGKISLGLIKGTLWHRMQKIWNDSIYNLQPTKPTSNDKFEIHKLCSDWLNKNCPPEIVPLDRLLILKRFAEYRSKYLEISGTIVAVEKGFTKELYRDDYVIIVYEGKIDLLIQRHDGILVWRDYKTQHPKFTQDLYPYSNQFLGYTWAIGNNHGIVDYTTWSKTITDRTFRAKLETYDNRRLERWKNLTIKWAHKIVRSHILEDFIETFSECDGKYGICPFTKICNIEPAFRERVKRNEFNKVEPYKSW